MPVIARDSVASDHLVYAWPFPIGPEEHEVSCAEDELVVMCPAWLVGDRLGPGRHRWRTPDPSRPVSAYFVLTAPVEVSFDMITQFLVPTTGQGVRLRAIGSLQVRCMDPALLVAQFVGLPFDAVNDGVVRSVSRSIERMLARLLTRRVVAAGTPLAVTDPSMLQNIIEELVAYNPTAGAVFGVELMRVGRLSIAADDGSRPWQQMLMQNEPAETRRPTPLPVAPSTATTQEVPLLETARGTPHAKSRATAATLPPPTPQLKKRDSQPNIASGEIGGAKPKPAWPQNEVSGEIGGSKPRAATQPPTEVSGEIGPKPRAATPPPTQVSGEIGGAKPPPTGANPPTEVSGEISGTHREKKKTSLGLAVSDPAIPLPKLPATTPTGSQPGARPITPIPAPIPTTPPPGIDVARTPPPGSLHASMASPAAHGTPPPQPTAPEESRGAILGIGVAHIGSSQVASGEITKKIAPGGRVLVPGPNGLMQSATVLQLLQGYYELEVGGSGETIWVPVSGVVPE